MLYYKQAKGVFSCLLFAKTLGWDGYQRFTPHSSKQKGEKMNYYNPYYGQNMMPQMPQSMPVQSIQQVQKTAQFYNVESAGELDGIKPTLNVLYV